MQQSRIPRSALSPSTWVGAGALVTLLAGAAAALTLHGATPVPAATAPQAHVVAVDIVAPQPVDITFAAPVARKARPAAPKAAPKPVIKPVAVKVRPVQARAAVAPVVTPADSTCSGAGWQQRRGEKALGSLLHPIPAGVTVSFLPGRGSLKGMTYYESHHVDVYVQSCSDESDSLLQHVVAHEMGHAWDSAHMTDALRADYLKARGIAAGTPWFGCNGCRDFATPAGDFAETYAQWQRGASDSRTQISHPASPSELNDLARFFQ